MRWLSTAIRTYLLHPLHGNGYQLWSGVGSDLGELSILIAMLAYLRHHNCHVPGCWRLGWRPHPEHDYPVCRKHHPHAKAAP